MVKNGGVKRASGKENMGTGDLVRRRRNDNPIPPEKALEFLTALKNMAVAGANCCSEAAAALQASVTETEDSQEAQKLVLKRQPAFGRR
ncbi:MAG: hypothetical protein CMF50_10670 [Legionellales bacterium]|nr:hypothetical protein [Legionellales bacterium]|tara:strand:+ start:916 stop:1182 length:267 start_codon:yes stop_codon:yes gene_type:complete